MAWNFEVTPSTWRKLGLILPDMTRYLHGVIDVYYSSLLYVYFFQSIGAIIVNTQDFHHKKGLYGNLHVAL